MVVSARLTRHGFARTTVGDGDHRVADHAVADPVADPVDLPDDRVVTRAVVLDGFVAFRVERVAGGAECGEPLRGERGEQLVRHRAQRSGLQVAVLAGTVEVVDDRQQLLDHELLAQRHLGGHLLVGAALVVGELGPLALQGGGELGDLVDVGRRTVRCGGGAGPRRSGFGHVRLGPIRAVGGVLGHLFSPSPSSTTSASTTSSSAAAAPASPAEAADSAALAA